MLLVADPEFFAFMGTHTQGKYSSLAQGLSEEHNSEEEAAYGWLNWELLRTGKGVYKNIVRRPCPNC